MEKKATRAAAITKVATRAKPARLVTSANIEERLEQAKKLTIGTGRNTSLEAVTLPNGRGALHGAINTARGRGRTIPSHINPDKLNPYLTASGSILPVSPKVISFVYSLDGCASGSSKPNSFDNQWKRGCFYTNAKFRPFFTKDILEQERTRDLKEFAGKLRDLSQKTALKMKKK